MPDGEKDRLVTFESLREDVLGILAQAAGLFEEQVDLEAAIVEKAPAIISNLSGLLFPIMRPIARPLTYSTDVERCVNTSGVELLDGEVRLFFDGNMYAENLGPKPAIAFVPEFLARKEVYVPECFIQLLESLIERLVETTAGINKTREGGLSRLKALKTKAKKIG